MTQRRFVCPGAAPLTDQLFEAFGARDGSVTTLVSMTVSPEVVSKSTTIEKP
jgi:hypothetical protein